MKIDSRKKSLVLIVHNWIHRSGITIEQIVNTMIDEYGCDIDRARFENRFTTRYDKLIKIPIEYMTALLKILSKESDGRCFTASEVLEVIVLTELPFSYVSEISSLFGETEFDEALSKYGFRLGHHIEYKIAEKEIEAPLYVDQSDSQEFTQYLRLAEKLESLTGISSKIWLEISAEELGRFDKVTNMAKLLEWFRRFENQRVSPKMIRKFAERVVMGNWDEWNIWHVSEVLPLLVSYSNYDSDTVARGIYNSEIHVPLFKNVALHLSKLAKLGVSKHRRDEVLLNFFYNQSLVEVPTDYFIDRLFE